MLITCECNPVCPSQNDHISSDLDLFGMPTKYVMCENECASESEHLISFDISIPTNLISESALSTHVHGHSRVTERSS